MSGEIKEDAVVVDFVVRGDDSLGPLHWQRPEYSRLVSADGIPLDLKDSKIISDGAVEISGSLVYNRLEGSAAPFQFSYYGMGGYSVVELVQFSVHRGSSEEVPGDEEMGEAR